MTKRKSTRLPKIVLSPLQDVPLNKLVLAPTNVRHVQNGLSIEELAEDISRRGLLQNICVRPQIDAEGEATGIYEIPAGGRRFRALQLLVEQKRLAKDAPIACLVRTEGLAEEDSLAENVQRVPLHPLDQYRAFATLRDKGLSDDDIAARFFVSVQVVRQRLKLAAASPVLLAHYEADELALAQLEAFCITEDHARQEHVWQALQNSHYKEPYQIRRMLTETAVPADDRRAVFVGLDVYAAAGGTVVRDLFQQDDGGYLQDAALLDRLALAKLEREAEAVRGEGWRWIDVALDYPWEVARKLRRVPGVQPPLTEAQQAEETALQEEAERLQAAYDDGEDTDAIDARLDQVQSALDALENRPAVYEPADIARSGVFLSIDNNGQVRAERGLIRPEDNYRDAQGGNDETTVRPETTAAKPDAQAKAATSERLLVSLTAWRSVALREAVGWDPDTALVALLHKLCLDLFVGGFGAHSCLQIDLRCRTYPQASGLADSDAERGVQTRHDEWAKELPSDADALWQHLAALDRESQLRLLAHCVAMGIDTVHEDRPGRRGGHTEGARLAACVGFDPVAAGWRPTEATYLGHVTKAQILTAVREARGEAAAQRLASLRKGDLVREAEQLLAGSGWLPPELRIAPAERPDEEADAEAQAEVDGAIALAA